MTDAAVPKVTKALNAHLQANYTVHINFSEDDVRHFLTPKEQVMYAWYVEDDSGEVTDFISYYALNSSVLGNDKHNKIYAAYAFYNFVKDNDPSRMRQLMRDLLINAKQNNFDVFNMVEVLQHSLVKNDLLFKPGDGKLAHYLYNWRIRAIPANKIGIVLV